MHLNSIGLRTAVRLPGEYDENFKIEAENGKAFLLKVARSQAPLSELEYQNAVLGHLQLQALDLQQQHILPTLKGEEIGTLRTQSDEVRRVRLLTFVPGQPLSDVRLRTSELLESLGAKLALLDRALQDFTHPLASRDYKWNLLQAHEMLPFLRFVEEPGDRELAGQHLRRFSREIAPLLAALPWSVIHGDANDHNIIVDAVSGDTKLRVSAIVDFGDALLAPTICDLAIAIAYAMFDEPEPLAAAAHVVRGYNSMRPIGIAELAVLYPLAETRLAMSIANSANEKRLRPDDAYVTTSEAPAWALLERLEDFSDNAAFKVFREVC